MNAEAKKKWIDALRSGKYAQGTGRLRREVDGKDCFCCLGVCLDVNAPEGWKQIEEGPGWRWRYEADVPHEKYPLNLSPYIRMNDHKGKTFEEIADFVEVNE